MKVLKKENISEWKHIYTCSRCKSELEAEGSDIQHKTVKKYGNDPRDPGDSFNADVYYLSCAVCSHTLDLDENKIPYLLKTQAKLRKTTSTGAGYGYFGDK